MILTIVLVSLSASIAGAAYITNPFSRFSIIRQPFVVEVAMDSLNALNDNHKIVIRQRWWWRLFAILKCGLYIMNTRYVSSPRSEASSVKGIVSDIHKLRFKPKKLLLTSGDHFSALFVRNLGVFYYPMLDTRIASSKHDWQNRQVVYLQTVAYALGVFQKYPVPTTTIVAMGAYSATCVNFYAYPSDTLYGILYALAALLGKQDPLPGESYGTPHHTLDTKPATQILLEEYRTTIGQLYSHYRTTVFDVKTGLIDTNIHISSAKDITRRYSAFYDNVVFWKTSQLAMELGIIPHDPAFLQQLKKQILQTFWLRDKGYFLEDLSEEGKHEAYYSSDWLIVLSTGFLHPKNKSERHYFEQSIDYIRAHGIDKPFAIKYQHETRAHRQFWAVRIAVASYGGDAIWSFWGMEYIKTLLLLYKYTDDAGYLAMADFHLAAYEHAMLRDGGFPEVYDSRGKLLETRLYRSIRQTGWVIGFEQVKAMRANIRKGTA
jgi:hypothetical protein